jgi:hypothetical protein
MSYDIATVGFCPQYFATFEVTGSKSNIYQVTLDGAEGPAHCTCPAYAYSKDDNRTCKHIAAIWKHGCLWNPQWKDAGPNDLDSVGTRLTGTHGRPILQGERCHGCGQDCVAVRIAV